VEHNVLHVGQTVSEMISLSHYSALKDGHVHVRSVQHDIDWNALYHSGRG